MINENLTVVTVTLNNKLGLEKTLNSLCNCKCTPFEVIVVDGGSIDDNNNLIDLYKNKLNIKYISEADNGIYDAMNKGLRNVRTRLVHYLNSGDTAEGDLYRNCVSPGLFPVKIHDPTTNVFWFDKIKMSGYGYCHQGVIFPSDHFPFSMSYKIASDFESISKTFNKGLKSLPLFDSGFVVYELGGVSSVKYRLANREIIDISFKNHSPSCFVKNYLYIKIKEFLPRYFKRLLAKILY